MQPLGTNDEHTYTINDNDAGGITGLGGVNDTTDYVAWLRADRRVYSDAGSTAAVDGDGVGQWNDMTGYDNNACSGHFSGIQK